MVNNVKSNIVKIAIWGPPGSGKTTYLVMLQYADHQGWKIRPKNRQANDLIVNGLQLLRVKREHVPPSVPGQPSFLPFEFVRNSSGLFQKAKSFTVILPECAGEDYANPQLGSDLVREIGNSHGILWLIDPLQIDNPNPEYKNYLQMIQEWLFLLYDIQGGGDINKYMAFCLTKMDHPDHIKHINDPYNHCLDILGPEIAKLLEDFCILDRIKFFATSSVGFSKDGTSNINPETDELLAPAEPVGLFNPFRWLFSVL
jgi:hypothetical protein